MGMYWLLDRGEHKGATALVETDGSMHIIDVHGFGAGITELEEQQAIWNEVAGHLAPTLKPFVDASTIDEEVVAPHPELQHDAGHGNQSGRRSTATRQMGGGRTLGGPSKKRSRGER